MKKIIVTGGAGYIGSHTVLALIEAGYEPIIIDNLSNSSTLALQLLNKISGKNIAFFQVDCTERAALEAVFASLGKVEAVIHFAAYKAVGESVQKPTLYYANNLSALWNVLDLIEKYQIPHFIFSSSATVYGDPLALPLKEEMPLQKPTNPYGASKQMGEQIIADFQRAQSQGTGLSCCRAVILRYFNPIGAHGEIGEFSQEKPNNLVPYLALAAAGRLPYLTIFGQDYPTADGTCIRDYVDVRDLARAHVQSLDFLHNTPITSPEIFNIGVGQGTSVLECVQTFERVNQVSVPYRIGPRRAGDLAVLYADAQKAKNLLGWQAQYSLEESLQKVWQWQKAFLF